MPFLRFTRDGRGYENTFLLHATDDSERPRILYWYRSAPGVRVGRSALDEDAIRTIEEQHPDVDFDWPHILAVGAASQPEVERRPQPPRRKAPKVREQAPAATQAPPEATVPVSPDEPEEVPLAQELEAVEGDTNDMPVDEPRVHGGVLEELVGREIATRLRARYAEISARIHQLPIDLPARAVLQARAEALNPDMWLTPTEMLHGVRHADQLFDTLRRELLEHRPS